MYPRRHAGPPPNILFFLTDQHNARCMSCAGEPLLRTPVMDRLALQGVRFTSAYANSMHCGYECPSWPKALLEAEEGVPWSEITARGGPREDGSGRCPPNASDTTITNKGGT